jgi:hypothetical protein
MIMCQNTARIVFGLWGTYTHFCVAARIRDTLLMTANPYTLSKKLNTAYTQNTQSTGIGWYDFDAGVREQILRHSHPAKTEAVEWVAPDSTSTRYEFTRERKRLAGPDLLKISVTRRAGTEDARTHTWHNVSRIRLYFFAHSHYELTFVGRVAEDEERARSRRLGLRQPPGLAEDDKIFYLPYANDDWDNWMWPRTVYETQRHVFEELGMTLHRTRDEAGEEVLEYRF